MSSIMDFITSNPVPVSALIFLAFAIPISIMDFTTRKIPDLLNYMSSIVLLCYRFACTRHEFIIYFVSGVFSVVFFLFIRLYTKRGLGWGDIKYSASCGLYAGPIAVFVGFVYSAIICGIYILILKAMKKYTKGQQIPFAPFLAAGALLSSIPSLVMYFSS